MRACVRACVRACLRACVPVCPHACICMYAASPHLPFAAAILVYFGLHVTEPPPELLFSQPALYISMLENAGGIILAQFLLHVGLPTMYWQRSFRREDGKMVDHLHAFAFHVFRAAGKTSSREISILHLGIQFRPSFSSAHGMALLLDRGYTTDTQK